MCAGQATKPVTVKDLLFGSDRFRLNCRLGMAACILLAASSLGSSISRAVAAETQVVDPFAVVAAFDRAAQLQGWPGFDATAYPIAIYDGERTLLLRHPNPPAEFLLLPGHEGVRVSPGKHSAMRWNSNADIGGVPTATLLLTIEPGRTVDYEAHILFHEVFHLFSRPLHPTWSPNEIWRYNYPVDDLENYRQLLLEEEALAKAMESESDSDGVSWAAAALTIRLDRQARLSQEHRSYETALELQEGTAVYMGRSMLGVASETERLREDRGPAGIRWRFYETGAAISVILDRLAPSWKEDLDARPEVTFTQLLSTALAAMDADPATFSNEVRTRIEERAITALNKLSAEREQLYDDFLQRRNRVIIRLADEEDHFSFDRFDPMAVEILDQGEALQAHLLTSSHPRGEVSFENPRFLPRSLEGVIALTSPVGQHPFLGGYRRIAFSGFSDKPVVERNGIAVNVKADGLFVSFSGATIESTDHELIITVLPSAAIE
ncbi:MAG: hypothetical protein JSU96_03270 [Acidobacteriota bacterium]|nr:MAG: hypothetical protein JSU96_03270 [Acidobacteriota bacterium]